MANKKINYNGSKIVSALCGVALILAVTLACGDSNTNNNNNRNESSENRNTENENRPMPTNQSTPNSTPTPEKKSYRDNLPSNFRVPDDEVGKRIMADYGAVYVARGVTPPPTVMFGNESECSSWQSQVRTSRAQIGSVTIELQDAAMTALQSAIAEAKGSGLSITPRGADSAKRSYSTTVDLWQSRVNPGLTYWTGKGRITAQEAARIKALSPVAQVPEVLRLEAQGIYFSKDFSKSILYSVAAPGTSQHLSMLALDVAEFDNPSVRAVLAKHYWYQTVVSDLPHFTYLGASETDLPSLGLKSVNDGGRTFWIPAL